MITAPTDVFAALADDTRWTILTRLGQAPASASALARELPGVAAGHRQAPRGASRRGAGRGKQQGRQLVHRAIGGRLSDVARDLEQIAAGWDRSLAHLKRLAEDPG